GKSLRARERDARVTVLIPTYNGAHYLAQCLQSVISQTFEAWKALVADDASTDSTVELAATFADPRIELIRRDSNIGTVSNINLLLAEVDTEYVAILHQDDWWEPEFLATMVR